MPYIGGSVARLFGEEARAVTARAARKMCDEGGRSILRVVTINTPVRTGRLRASWRQSSARESFSDAGDPGYESAVESDLAYAPYVEHGTGLWGSRHAPYEIRPRKPGGVLRWVAKDGRVVFARYVLHPGSPGHHMMAIALNVTEGLAADGALFGASLEAWAREVEASGSRG